MCCLPQVQSASMRFSGKRLGKEPRCQWSSSLQSALTISDFAGVTGKRIIQAYGVPSKAASTPFVPRSTSERKQSVCLAFVLVLLKGAMRFR